MKNQIQVDLHWCKLVGSMNDIYIYLSVYLHTSLVEMGLDQTFV